jgi:ADP-heptose:LPS heptosyltransferase
MSLIPKSSEVVIPERAAGTHSPAHPASEPYWRRHFGPVGAGCRVLLIHSGHLGDGVLALGAMRAARRAMPAAELAAVVTPPVDGLIRRGGWFNHVWTLPAYSFPLADPLRMVRTARLTARVIAWKPHVAVSYTPDPEDLLLARLSLAPERIGASKEHDLIYTKPWLTKRLLWDHIGASVAGRYAAISALAGFGEPTPSPHRDLPLNDNEQSATTPPPNGAKLFVLLVCGSAAHRRWPLEHYAATARELRLRHPGCKLMIVTGPGERDLKDRIAQDFIATGLAESFDCRPLTELVGLLRIADLAVTVDSGPGHIAAATGAPTIYLIPDRKRATHSPPGAHVTVVSGESVAAIPADEVIRALP